MQLIAAVISDGTRETVAAATRAAVCLRGSHETKKTSVAFIIFEYCVI